jgi:integrase
MTNRQRRTDRSYCTGERGRNRVRAYVDDKSGAWFLEFYERDFGCKEQRRKRVQVGRCDREVAKQKADELAAALGKSEPRQDVAVSLRELFDNYLRGTTGQKGESKRKHDERAAEMFLRFLGPQTVAKSLNRRHWDRFIAARRSGEVAPAHVRRPRRVGERVVAYDLTWLMTVMNWATVSGADGREGVLLERNPLKGLPMPKNESPRRAAIDEAQYERLLAISHTVGDRFHLALVLAHETGHRIGSIRQLRWSDIDLETDRVRWRAENDKIGFEHVTPLTGEARNALLVARARQQAIGAAWVFPSPSAPAEPCSRHLVRDWWERAAAAAELPRGERYGWHSLRRKFASEMKETDLRNLCHLGGWKSSLTVLTCYQQPDEARQRAALATRQQRRGVASTD